MRRSSLPILLLFAGSIHASGTAFAAQDQQSLSLELIFSGTEFRTNLVENVQWKQDGSAFVHTRRNADTGLLDIYEHDVRSGDSRLRLSASQLTVAGQPLVATGYEWTDDGRFLLVMGSRKLTWDSVIEAPYYVYDADTGTVRALAGGSTALRNVRLSPDGRHVGYVLENDIHVTELASGDSRAVTSDGSTDVFNGIFDYGSTEFGFTQAWHWSPDGRKLAFWRLDASDVKVFYMVDELGKYNTVRPLKYPNTGERHAVNRIGVHDLETGGTTWMDIGDDVDDYIPRIDWTRSAETLSIQRLTRDHELLELLFADVESGRTSVIVSDTDPAWIDITEDLIFFKEEDRFVWTSEKSGYRHAYLYDYQGNERQLTRGDWEISSLISVDETVGWLYFYAKKDSFIDQHVYRVRLDGSGLERLTAESGWHEWSFSPGARFVIAVQSDAGTLPVTTLREASGEPIRTLASGESEALARYGVPNPEFMKITTSDGIELNAYMIKPPDFDPDRKYPVIGYGYGNAGSQMVVNRWGSARGANRDLWHRYMAQQGFIVFTLDNRTTAGRGKKAKNLTYGHYAKFAVHDQLEGVRYLKSLPYVDAARIGFWGWSGGGYLTGALMTKGAPHYKVGVSVAPVIDLTRYQAVGVERWMGFLHEHEEGYRQTNLLNYADRLEGDLLLIHGTGDENVKFAFTLQFADALIRNGKQFDMMVYPNQHHGIQDHQLHVYTKIADYFLEKL